MCTRCIEIGIWDKPLGKKDPCKICGENRWYSWASFDYEGSEKNIHTLAKQDRDILPDFVNWLLHFEQENTAHLMPKGEKRKTYQTICYAHNGKRVGINVNILKLRITL